MLRLFHKTDDLAPYDDLLADDEFWKDFQQLLNERLSEKFLPIFLAGSMAAARLRAKRPVGKEFDPNQPRDEHGQWTDSGGGGGSEGVRPGGGMRDAVGPVSERMRANAEKWLKEEGVTREALSANLQSALNAATPQERAEGMVWYDRAHETAAELGERYGVSTEQAAGVLAALSPRTDWDDVNKPAADRLLAVVKEKTYTLTERDIEKRYAASVAIAERAGAERETMLRRAEEVRSLSREWVGTRPTEEVPSHILALTKPVGVIADNAEKGIRIARGEDPVKVLSENPDKGFKVRSFYSNIADPKGSREVTIDTHMVNAAMGKIVGERGAAPVFNARAKYATVRDALRSITPKGMSFKQVQAIIWMHQMHLSAAGKTLDADEMDDVEYANWLMFDLIWQGFSDLEAAQIVLLATKEWDEDLHPRDEAGRFTSVGLDERLSRTSQLQTSSRLIFKKDSEWGSGEAVAHGFVTEDGRYITTYGEDIEHFEMAGLLGYRSDEDAWGNFRSEGSGVTKAIRDGLTRVNVYKGGEFGTEYSANITAKDREHVLQTVRFINRSIPQEYRDSATYDWELAPIWSGSLGSGSFRDIIEELSPVMAKTKEYWTYAEQVQLGFIDGLTLKEWNEEDHPRDERGRFTDNGGGEFESYLKRGGGGIDARIAWANQNWKNVDVTDRVPFGKNGFVTEDGRYIAPTMPGVIHEGTAHMLGYSSASEAIDDGLTRVYVTAPIGGSTYASQVVNVAIEAKDTDHAKLAARAVNRSLNEDQRASAYYYWEVHPTEDGRYIPERAGSGEGHYRDLIAGRGYLIGGRSLNWEYILKEWNEEDHPRDEIGRFTFADGGGGGGASEQTVHEHVRVACDRLRADHGTPVKIAKNELRPLMQTIRDEQISQNLEVVSVAGEKLYTEHLRELTREEMPQLPETMEGLHDFNAYMEKEGVGYRIEKVDPRELTATQNQLDSYKVAQIAAAIEKEGGLKPGSVLLVSREGGVLDGHHRWAAAATTAVYHDVEITVVRYDADIDKMLKLAGAFEGVEHEGLHAALESGMRRTEGVVAGKKEKAGWRYYNADAQPTEPPPNTDEPWVWLDGKWWLVVTDNDMPRKIQFDEPVPLEQKEFDPNQPRDERGQWTDSGGGVATAEPTIDERIAMTSYPVVPASQMPLVGTLGFMTEDGRYIYGKSDDDHRSIAASMGFEQTHTEGYGWNSEARHAVEDGGLTRIQFERNPEGALIVSIQAKDTEHLRDTAKLINHRIDPDERAGTIWEWETYESQLYPEGGDSGMGSYRDVQQAHGAKALRRLWQRLKAILIGEREWNEEDHPRDEIGRFTDSGGGGEASGKLAPALARAERNIRNNPVEAAVALDKDGKILFETSGEYESVTFNEGELARLRGATLTHNHPLEYSLSRADVETANEYKVAEIRAVTPKGKTFSIKPKDGKWMSKLEFSIRLTAAATQQEAQDRRLMMAGKLTIDEANLRYHDKLWRENAKELGIVYKVTGK